MAKNTINLPIPDVNILVHAFRADSPEHSTCRKWLEGVVNGEGRFGMALQVMSSMIRITTHPKVFATPSSLDEAFRFCSVILDQPNCVIICITTPYDNLVEYAKSLSLNAPMFSCCFRVRIIA